MTKKPTKTSNQVAVPQGTREAFVTKGRELVGTVASTSMQKTVIVEVVRSFRHPVYKKMIKKVKRIPAHVENATFQVGDTVRIVETRPISKTKHFAVVEKVSLHGLAPADSSPLMKAKPRTVRLSRTGAGVNK